MLVLKKEPNSADNVINRLASDSEWTAPSPAPCLRVGSGLDEQKHKQETNPCDHSQDGKIIAHQDFLQIGGLLSAPGTRLV
jgi:hypothetical protein